MVNVLLVTHVVPYPPAAGNEIRILKLIAWFRGQGCSVTLLLNVRELPPRVTAALVECVDRLVLLPATGGGSGQKPHPVKTNPLIAGLAWRLAAFSRRVEAFPVLRHIIAAYKLRQDKTHHEPALVRAERGLCPPTLIQTTASLCNELRPQIVIAEYIFLSACLDVTPPGTLKIIDTIDMFSQKKSGVLAHGIDDPLAITPAQERERLLKADLIIAIQAREAELMAQLVPERQVITVGIDFEVIEGGPPEQIVPGRILVVGSDNPMNLHGLRSFLADAWPVIRAHCPEATLRIVGKVGKAVEMPLERVELAGWVESLASEYAAADVVINPTVAGTGLKIKTVEALCHGNAVVAWPNGVDGLASADPAAFVVADDWIAFGEAVTALIRDPFGRARLQERALRYARDHFDRDRVYAPLRRALLDHGLAVSPPSTGQDLPQNP